MVPPVAASPTFDGLVAASSVVGATTPSPVSEVVCFSSDSGCFGEGASETTTFSTSLSNGKPGDSGGISESVATTGTLSSLSSLLGVVPSSLVLLGETVDKAAAPVAPRPRKKNRRVVVVVVAVVDDDRGDEV